MLVMQTCNKFELKLPYFLILIQFATLNDLGHVELGVEEGR